MDTLTPQPGLFWVSNFSHLVTKKQKACKLSKTFCGNKRASSCHISRGGGGGVWLLVPQDVKFPHKIRTKKPWAPKNAFIYVNGWDWISSSQHLWSVFKNKIKINVGTKQGFYLIAKIEKQQGVCHSVALPITLKLIWRQKKNYWNSNIWPCKNIIL